MEIRINGASDDLIEINGDTALEYDTNGRDKWSALIQNNGAGEALVVVATYVNPGVWLLGVTQIDEDQQLPPWPIRIEAGRPSECSYSPTLVIEAPAGTVLVPGYLADW